MQGVANLLSPLICWMFIAICGDDNYDLVWRLSFTMGAIPAVVIIICCYWVIETKKDKKSGNNDPNTVATDANGENSAITPVTGPESDSV